MTKIFPECLGESLNIAPDTGFRPYWKLLNKGRDEFRFGPPFGEMIRRGGATCDLFRHRGWHGGWANSQTMLGWDNVPSLTGIWTAFRISMPTNTMFWFEDRENLAIMRLHLDLTIP